VPYGNRNHKYVFRGQIIAANRDRHNGDGTETVVVTDAITVVGSTPAHFLRIQVAHQ
jgi:hypothetical protein